MSLWRIAWRYLWSRPLVAALTLAGVALGAALIAGVLTIRRETERVFLDEGAAFDLVVGAKGSPLQLVLSSVYHLDVPTGNIPLSQVDALKADMRVRSAIPIGLGDNFRGYRIVGTTPEFFDLTRRDPDTDEDARVFAMAEGAWDFSAPFNAVLGADVARRSELRVGDTFVGSHGIVAVAGSEEHADSPYTVVGILEPSGTSNDRAVFASIEATWVVHDKEAALHERLYGGGEASADDSATSAASAATPGWLFAPKPVSREREVTAILVQLQSPGLRFSMVDEVNKQTNAMAAVPINEMMRLYQLVLAPMQQALLAVAYLVVVVAGLSVLATLYQAAERRRRDIAVMRALGATPPEVFAVVLFEAALVAVIGTAAGWLLGHGAVQAAEGFLRDSAGLSVAAWRTDAREIGALAAVAGIGLVAGLFPAILAYRRAPAKDLSAV